MGVTVPAVYQKTGTHDFVNYDDQLYVYENPVVQKGLTTDGVRWALTTTAGANWHPLTWLSQMADVSLFGMAPGPHHLVNVGIHYLNALVLFIALRAMTGAVWRSAMVAALFAVHPLHVESVAWIAERKDVLSTFFGLLSLRAYVKFARKPTVTAYVGVLLLMALSLAAKPMFVTLPFVLLLLDYWPLGRVWVPGAPGGSFARRSSAALFVEKIPLLLLTAASCVITVIAQTRGFSVGDSMAFPLSRRISNALVSYVVYGEKMFWPARLAVIYPHSGTPDSAWHIAGAAALLVLATYGSLRVARRFPQISVGWFFYLGTLVPVIGLVQVGIQTHADRYTYLPLTGLFVAIVWTVPSFFSRWRHGKSILAAVSVLVLISLAGVARTNVQYWKNSVTLFEHALEVVPGNWIATRHLPDAHYKVGAALGNAGKIEEAVGEFREAIRLQPGFALAHYSLGLAYRMQGKATSAEPEFREALRLAPGFAEARTELEAFAASAGSQENKASKVK